MGGGELADLAELAATTDEEEGDVRVGGHFARSVQYGVERVAGAVVAGIHDHKLSREAVCGTEAVTGARVIIDDGIVRPGRQDEGSGSGEAFGNDAIAHEAVQH